MVTVISLLCWGFYFMGAFIDISGMKFGKLTVIGKSKKQNSRYILWDCICECGGKRTTRGADLKNNKTKSCGCLHTETLIVRNKTHGMSGHRIYKIWKGMIKRCDNPKCIGYRLYGGIGVKVCDRWYDFENFYSDTINGYFDNLSLDRYPDKHGHYEPNNFRWATRKQQNNNKRNNTILTFNGISATVSEWSNIIGLSASVIYRRLDLGWTTKDTLTTEKIQKKK